MCPLSYIFYLLLGFSVGSFINAYTYRAPRGESVLRGRSFCPHCKKKIAWYDNIPLFSFILLKGKCRGCNKKISWRYPLIELSTGFGFLGTFLVINNCATTLQGTSLKGSPACLWYGLLDGLTLPFFILVLTILIAIFIVDLEHQLILNELVLTLFLITLILLLISSSPTLFLNLLSGFGAATFFLIINLLTQGRGMGLGDVKLALVGGIILGWPQTLIWLFLSFVIGAFIGLILIALGKASFGKQIPFAPFLAISLIAVFVWGDILGKFIFFSLR